MPRRSAFRPARSLTHNAAFQAVEALEVRLLWAAHIVGSATSYSTIQAAVNAASPGSVVTVDAGTYNEQITVSKSLTIRGAQAGVDGRTRSNASETIVDGIASGSVRTSSFYITASDVTIDGFTVQGETSQSVSTGAGVVIAPGVAGTHIYNNIIQNNVAGIFLANSSSSDAAIIQHNSFNSNNNAGVDGGRGIYSDGGISGGNLTNVWIDANNFNNNHGGSGTTTAEAAVAFEAQSAGKQSNLHVTNNSFSGNGKATLCFYCDTVYIEGNTINNQGDSAGTIRFEGGDNNIWIRYNTCFSNDGTCVAIDAKGVPATDSNFDIEYNNFYNNSVDWGDKLSVIAQAQYYVGTLNAEHNWWGNASGPGGQGPGTGDKIYGDGHWNSGQQWTESVGNEVDFSNWATALITHTVATAPAAPSATAALTTNSAASAQVSLTWSAGSDPQTQYVLYRSTDGNTYTPIGIYAITSTGTTDSGLSTGTSYYYKLAIENSAGVSTSTAVTVATPTVIATPLSTLNWTSATSGYGVVHKNTSINGGTLTLNGTTYGSGIGTHAASTITYNLAGQYTTFVSDVGIDGEEDGQGNGSVDFKVINADNNTVLYDSGVLTNDQVGHISVSVAGINTLQLVAVNGVNNSVDYDHADWAGAALYGTPNAPLTPTNVSASSNATSNIFVLFNAGSPNTSYFRIDRSTDGVNFTTLATNISASSQSYNDSGLTPGSTYYYRVVAINSVGSSAPSAVVHATTTLANSTTVALSTLQWASATAGYGTVQLNKSINGNPLTLNGGVSTTGLGTHASSTIVYNLAGKYSNFSSLVGIDSEEDGKGLGSVDFKVYGDGTLFYDSGILTNDQIGNINVSVAGVQTLTLQAINGVNGSIDYDHADFASATLTGIPSVPTPPTNVLATATSSSAIKLAWTIGSSDLTSYTIQRSVDGTNFSNIATGISASATSYTDNVGLSANTQYFYRVIPVNSSGNGAASAVVNATTQQLYTVTYTSDLTATSSTVGYGTIQKDKSINGNPLTLNGVVYSKGIGTHAASTITYNLAGKYSFFQSDVGIDSEEDGKGNGYVDFQVINLDNNTVLFDSGVLTNDQVAHVNVNVGGVQNLELVATNGIAGTINYDHADWAGAQLLA